MTAPQRGHGRHGTHLPGPEQDLTEVAYQRFAQGHSCVQVERRRP